MFTISVCMIIKDEEKTLARILSSVKKFADEIVIVDTGSKDNSIEIARKFTDKIFHFIWIDNFGEARNFSFSKATKDYIMWLDADDVIKDCEIEKILKLKQSTTDIDMYLFKYCMGFDGDTPTFVFYRERLLKREYNYHWQGFIHEVIPISGKTEYVDISIEHRKEKASDNKRNLKIYRRALKKGVSFTPRDIYYYSRELYYNGFYKSSLKYLKNFLKCSQIYPPNEIEATLLIYQISIILNDIALAKKYLFNCIQKHTPNAQICCAIGHVCSLENNLNLSEYWYKSALSANRNNGGFHEIDYEEFIPHLELSVIYYNLGKYIEAKNHHLLAKAIKPNHPSIISNNKFFIN